jgi:hypothetical protein
VVTSRGDAFRTPTSRQHHSTAGAAVRVRVAPAAAGTPGRRRRRTDARPGALTAGGETAMVRTAERLQSARLGSRLSTEAPDRGPDPRHRRRRACPDPPGLHTRYHGPRTPDDSASRSRSTAPAAGCARDTATVTTVSPDERQSETDSARRPGKRHMRTAHTSHMRHARKDDLCMPQADHFHVCRMAQNAHKPIGHGPCGKPSSFAASRGPPRSTHREMRLPPRPGPNP